MWIAAYFMGLLTARYLLIDVLWSGELGNQLSSMDQPLQLGLQGLVLLLLVGLLLLWVAAERRERVLSERYPGFPYDQCEDIGTGVYNGGSNGIITCCAKLFANWRLNWIVILFIGGWLVQLIFLLFSVCPLLSHVDEAVTIKGIVVGEPRLREDRLTMTIQLRKWRQQSPGYQNETSGWFPGGGEVLITAVQGLERVEHGDVVQVSGLLSRPKRATVPGQFDYRNYLEHRGIYLQLKGEKLEKIREGSILSLNKAALAVRRKLASNLTGFFPGEEGQVLCGLVLGATENLDPELRETFNITGLGHLLSVSGFHVALVAGFFVLLGKGLGLGNGLTYWSTIAGVAVYSLISGLSPPVVRSAVMAGLGIYALLFNEHRHWPTALGLAAIITTLTQPEVIFEPGYQLSFAATWAILAFAMELDKSLKKIPRIPSWLATVLAVPLAAQLGTWPLLAYHFNQFSPWSVIANLLLVEVAGLMLLLGLTMALIACISLKLAGILQWGLGLLTRLFIVSATWLADLPGGVINLPAPPVWSIFCYYCLLWLVGSSKGRFIVHRYWRLCLFHRPNYRPGLLAAVALVVALLAAVITGGSVEKGLQITFLDVGEGDSIFIRTPEGKNLLIDAGPVQMNKEGKVIYDAGAKVVLPFLRSQGVNHLDLMILSHLHQDHCGGLPEVVNHIRVTNLVAPPLTGDSPEEGKVISLAEANHINLLTGREGQRILLDSSILLQILGPDSSSALASNSDQEDRLNNQSLVLQLAYGKHSYLFTGDVDGPSLEQLLASNKVSKLTMLKLPHHGSAYSFSAPFLESTRPELGVISVGTNYYGHPSSQLVNYFRQKAIPLLRTDEVGAVHISDIDGVAGVTTFNSPER